MYGFLLKSTLETSKTVERFWEEEREKGKKKCQGTLCHVLEFRLARTWRRLGEGDFVGVTKCVGE